MAKSPKEVRVVILVALIGLLATIFAALISVLPPTIPPASPTSDIAAVRTSAVATVIAQFTVTAAAFTPTASLLTETATGTLATTTHTATLPGLPIQGHIPIDPAFTAALKEVDQQFQESLRSNIAYNAPKTMKLDETITIELLLNPSLSQEQLATQLVERSDLLTSTMEPGQLLTEQGGEVEIVTGRVTITDRMKAVLKSQKLGAFEIQELHDSAEQPISSVNTSKWRWSVTSKEQGEQTLELILYRLIKYDDNEYWYEVEAYRADISVKVTVSQWLASLDWKWFLGILVTALLIPLFFRWHDRRKKKADEQKETRPLKKRRMN